MSDYLYFVFVVLSRIIMKDLCHGRVGKPLCFFFFIEKKEAF